MSLSVGIVGLPNAGKSTLFNALLQREVAQVAIHPFTTINPNKGVVSVPDERLDKLVKLFDPGSSDISEPGSSNKIEVRPAQIEFVDIAGLVKDAHKGEGLGNQFLSHIREVNLIVHVLREFKNDLVTHVVGKIDPLVDSQIVNLELILADLEVVDKALQMREKKAVQDKLIAQEVAVLAKVKKALDRGKSARQAELNNDEKAILSSFNLLTLKPVIYVVNINEDRWITNKRPLVNYPKGEIIVACLRLAADLYQLSEKEREEYLKQSKIKSPGLDELITTSFTTLNLITFYTIKGGQIVSAWPVKKGTTMLEAAHHIHTDFAKNFIKAEVIPWETLIKMGSWQKAREKGKIKIEGKESVVKDGDVVEMITG